MISLRKRILFFILITLIFSTFIFSQSHTIRNYGIEDGLPTNIVNDVIQGPQSRIWFATEFGITNYDGTNWISYNEKDGLIARNYVRIKFDNSGTAWAMPAIANLPIQFFDGIKWRLFSNPYFNFNDAQFADFAISINKNEKRILIATEKSIYSYQNYNWVNLGKNNKALQGKANSIISVGDIFYIANKNGLFKYDGTSLINVFSNNNIKNQEIKAIEFNKSVLWLLGNNWVGYWDFASNKLKVVKSYVDYKSNPERDRHFIAFDGINRVYYGGFVESFCLELNSKEIIHLGVKKGFTSDGSSSLLIDKEKNIWVVNPRGVDKMTNIIFENYFEKDGLLENEVTSIEEIEEGKYFLGHNSGFTIMQNNTFKTYRIDQYLPKDAPSSRIMDAENDSKGNILFAASNVGVGKFNSGKITWIARGNHDKSFNKIILDKYGNGWTSTFRELYKIKDNGIELIASLPLKHLIIRDVHFAADGKVLVTTTDGIYKLVGNKFVHYQNTKGSYYTLYDFDSASLLSGKQQGLFLTSANNETKFIIDSIFINRKVFSINVDHKGNKWFGTDDGFYKWDGKILRKFSKEEGLSGRETNRFAWLNDANDRIWLGTEKGLSCYLEEYDLNEAIPEILSIKLIDERGYEFNLNERVELEYDDNNFTLLPTAISFIDETKINYRAKLEGFDNDWVAINKTNSIRYTNIPSGEYKIIVQARNSDGSWSKQYTSSIIEIDLPMYFQWWFILLLLGLISGVSYYYYYSKKQKIYSAKLEQEITKQTDELINTQQRINALLDNTLTFISTIDAAGNILFINHDFDNYRKENLIGKNIYQLIPTNYYEKIKESIEKLFVEKQSVYFPYAFVFNSTPYYFESFVTPVISSDGTVKEAVAISIDLTEKFKSEKEKREFEEKQNAILNAVPIILYNDTNNVNDAPSWLSGDVFAITGFPKEDFFNGKINWAERVHHEDYKNYRSVMDSIESSQNKSIEYRWLTANNKYKWFLDFISSSKLKADGYADYIGVLVDITERKKIQQRLNLLTENILKFSAEPDVNIEKIINLCGSELNARFVNYYSNEEDKAIVIGNFGIIDESKPNFFVHNPLAKEILNKQQNEIVTIQDLTKTDYAMSEPSFIKEGIKTVLCSPVICENSVKGVISVLYDHVEEINENDIKFVKILSASISIEEERKKALTLLKESVKEKEILLREVFHRVKNNLQVINSLLYLQAENISDKSLLAVFQESQNRVRSMALVHESLYKSQSLTEINFREYIENLVKHLKDSFELSSAAEITLNIEKVSLNIEKAVPCGILLNELVTNAFKYGKPADGFSKLLVEISVSLKDNIIEIIIKDNGAGLKVEFNQKDFSSSLGMNLIKKLTRQIEGEVVYEYENGAKFIITFPQ